MNELISKLSKPNQRHVKLAIIHAENGNNKMLDSMLRSANTRSAPILNEIQLLIWQTKANK
jgi:hypothetical protein